MKRKREKGFSLIELLIVVAIILIIAAIAIPNLLRAKMQANQTSAVASLRTINTSEVLYQTTYGGYSAKLTDLGDIANACPASPPTPINACLVDNTLAQSESIAKSGYLFGPYAPGAPVGGAIGTFSITARPVSAGSTGQRYFYTDQTNVIRYNDNAAAAQGDSAI